MLKVIVWRYLVGFSIVLFSPFDFFFFWVSSYFFFRLLEFARSILELVLVEQVRSLPCQNQGVRNSAACCFGHRCLNLKTSGWIFCFSVPVIIVILEKKLLALFNGFEVYFDLEFP